MFDYHNSSEFANLEGTEENCEKLLSSHEELTLPIDTATDGSVNEGEGTYAYLFFNVPFHQLDSAVYGGGKESYPDMVVEAANKGHSYCQSSTKMEALAILEF